MSRWWADLAWLGGDTAARDVLLESADGRFTRVEPGVARASDAIHVRGLVIPGLANTHVHAFHRALRSRTQQGRGSFWSWRDLMYAIAGRLTPDSLYELALASYGEMALAGVTCVGEFHYVHHGPDGVPYDDPNAMSQSLRAAAAGAGIRLTLLDACYLAGGFDLPLDAVQLRFGDGDASAWAARVSLLRPDDMTRIGAAIHSVRAVPARDLSTVARWAREHGAPLHVHLSEQVAENTGCLERHGCTPTVLLNRAGVWGASATAVHATHLTANDIAVLGRSGTTISMCPTTERDLADGIGPARDLALAGCPLVLGSDSNAVVDLFEEARAVELDERLRSGVRGHWTAAELLRSATAEGHRSLGWPEAGVLAAGAPADFVSVRLDTVRTAGAPASVALEAAVFAATAADVDTVVVAGRAVVDAGEHRLLGDVARRLDAAIRAVTR